MTTTRTADIGTYYRTTYPAVSGEGVTQGHVDACATYGHATHVVDGVAQPHCPRCGEARLAAAPTEDSAALRTLILVSGADRAEAEAFLAAHEASGSDVHFSVAWVTR